MRTLIYKRTHTGDPDESGCFGIRDCMKRVRGFRFDAVIGVGGTGKQPREQGIAERITWIGLGPRRKWHPKRGGPLVTFEHFRFYDTKGKKLAKVARVLAKHMYSKNVRILLNLTSVEKKEVQRILKMANTAPPSKGVRALPHLRDRSRNRCDCRC